MRTTKTLTTREKQKQQSRAKIIKAASTLFGKQGLDSTGIDEIMKKAGLTAGAFYAHFKSKDALIQEVLWAQWEAYKTVRSEDFVAFYLTEDHRDRPQSACPLASFGSDLARADRELKSRISERLDHHLAERMKVSSMTKKELLRALSVAVGAMILSRITKDSALSKAFLECHE